MNYFLLPLPNCAQVAIKKFLEVAHWFAVTAVHQSRGKRSKTCKTHKGYG